jgi:hypothetical protein
MMLIVQIFFGGKINWMVAKAVKRLSIFGQDIGEDIIEYCVTKI